MSRLNTSTVEEEIVLLYTLYVCGRRPSKSRATEFILSNHFLQERDRDYGEVAGGESRIENRIAWTRENLRRKGYLGGQEHGIWDITPAGIERLRKTAIRSLTWDKEEFELLGIAWKRFTPAFLDRLKTLAEHFNSWKDLHHDCYAKFYSRSHPAVIRVYDEAGNMIDTYEHAGDFKEPWIFPP